MSFYTVHATKACKVWNKFWAICDADTCYVLQAFPYTGQTDRIEEGLGDHVVMKLMNPYFDTGLNVTTNNFLRKPFYYQEAQKTKL